MIGKTNYFGGESGRESITKEGPNEGTLGMAETGGGRMTAKRSSPSWGLVKTT